MYLTQSLTSIFALDDIERMRPDEILISGKFGLWTAKQRPLNLKCAAQDCENEPIHIDPCGIAFCISHCVEEID